MGPFKVAGQPPGPCLGFPYGLQAVSDRTTDRRGESGNVAKAPATVLQHISALRRYARALTGDPSETDDLVQECLSRALGRSHQPGEVRNLRAYLFTILHNAHVDRLAERQRWRSGTSDTMRDTLLAQPAPQDGRLALLDLAAALRQLPEEQRQAVLLVGYEGLAYKEAATVMNVPIGTVMSRLSRGREALRHMMTGAPLANLRKVK